VPRAEQYQADAGDGIAAANVAATTVAAKSDFIFSSLNSASFPRSY
jgi:hypothetical protein